MAAEFLQIKQKEFLAFYRDMEDYFDVCCQLLIQKELIAESEEQVEKASKELKEYKSREGIEDEEYEGMEDEEDERVEDEEYSRLRVNLDFYQAMLDRLMNQYVELEGSLDKAARETRRQAMGYSQQFKYERLPMIKMKERGHLRAAAYLDHVVHPKLKIPEGCWAITQKVEHTKVDMDYYRSAASKLGITYSIVDIPASAVKPPPRQPLLDPPTVDDDPNQNWSPNTCQFEEVDSITDLYARTMTR